MRTTLPYHIRVIIPCYKEPLDVIQKTVTAALVAPIPASCSRTGEWAGVGSHSRTGLRGRSTLACRVPACVGVRACFARPCCHPALLTMHPRCLSSAVYLLDDGRDIDKKKFMRRLGVSNAVYVRWGAEQ